jgi:capsule polysaccharide export protein KpsE/RkpR
VSAPSPKTTPETLRSLDIDQLLAHRLSQDQQESRNRRIARIGHLWERRRLLAKFIAWGAAAAFVIALVIPTRYAATTRLMPPDPPAGQGMTLLASIAGKMGASNLASLGGDLLGVTTSVDLFAGLLESRTVQNDLVTKFDLRNVYGERHLIDARKELARRTDLSIDRKSGILTIQVTDHDPKRATAMAQEYVAQLNNVVIQLNTSSAHRERVFLEARLNEVKTELESAESDFSKFASKNAAIDIQAQGKAMVEAGAVLEGQLIAAQTELQGLRQIYADPNIHVRTTQARVDELRRQILKMSGKQDSEGSLPLKDDELYPSIRKLPILGVTYADLFRHMKVEETVFETLTQQYEIAKVQEAKEVPSVKMLDPAELPEKKVFPPRTLLFFLGVIIAFGLGVGWISGSDGWNKIDSQHPGKVLVLNMVRSVKPPLQYVVQRGSFFRARTRKMFERFEDASAAVKTKHTVLPEE